MRCTVVVFFFLFLKSYKCFLTPISQNIKTTSNKLQTVTYLRLNDSWKVKVSTTQSSNKEIKVIVKNESMSRVKRIIRSRVSPAVVPPHTPHTDACDWLRVKDTAVHRVDQVQHVVLQDQIHIFPLHACAHAHTNTHTHTPSIMARS